MYITHGLCYLLVVPALVAGPCVGVGRVGELWGADRAAWAALEGGRGSLRA